MDYDKVIETLGDFGPFQRRLFIICLFPVLLGAFSTPLSVFLLVHQNHRCKLPNFSNDTYVVTNAFHRDLVNNSIPSDANGNYDNCNILDNGTLQKCSEWVYDQSVFSLTVTSQFNLVCEQKLLRNHSIMAYFIGFLIANFMVGPFADLIGRRNLACLASTLRVIANLAMPFSPSAYFFALCRVFDGITGVVYYQCAFIICMEFVGISKRLFSGTIILLVYCVGEFILVVIAYFIRDWRWLQLALAIPTAIPLIYWWPRIFPESPRWLMSRGRYDEAIHILQRAARVNKVELSEIATTVYVSQKYEQKVTFTDILKGFLLSRVLVIRWIIVFANWFVISFIYYGLTLNIGEFGGDIFVTFTIGVVVEMMGYSICLLLNRVGRKPLHLLVIFCSAVGCIISIFLTIFVKKNLNWILIFFAMIGKLFISAGYGEIYIYTGEIFPTVVRAFILSTCSLGARIASLLSPYLYLMADGKLGQIIPLIVYGVLTLLVGFLSIYLPETNGRKLPEKVESENVKMADTNRIDEDSEDNLLSSSKERKTNTTEVHIAL